MRDDDDPLSDLAAVDWASLSHAYGPASDVPGQLRDVASADAEARRKALRELWGNIHHQGTVYEASATAVPFLARLAGTDTIPGSDRAQLILLIAAIASGSSYLDVHEPTIQGGLTPDQRREKATELDWAARAHAAAAAVAPSLLAALPSAGPMTAWPLVTLAAQVPEASHGSVADLVTLAGSTRDPGRIKAVELTLALIDELIDFEDVRDIAAVREDLADLADPHLWRTPAQGAKYIVSTLLEEAEST